MNPICPYCGKKSQKLTETQFYGKEYKGRFVYACLACNASVGSHDDGSPLGRLATRELKALRIKCHALVDPLWKSRVMSRDEVYRVMVKRTGVRHIGEANEYECKKIIAAFTTE